MSVDPKLREQFVEARRTIIAQLDQLEFRVVGNSGGWRRRGPQDAGDIYDALKKELREVNELLGLDGDDENIA